MTTPNTTDTARLLTDYEVPAARGLATDEVLMGTTSLHLYTYRGAALVGRFQDLDANVDIEWCRDNDLEVNRRLTGGGAIVMTPDQLGIALTLNREAFDLPRNNRALFETFGAAITAALDDVGIDAQFVPKNDIVADGRKIAGLGFWDRAGDIQFHCSLLVDMDVELMLTALELTEEKLSDKHVAAFEDRITTVSEQAGVGMETVADAVETGFADRLELAFEPGELDPAEDAEVDRLVDERYGTEEWLTRVSADHGQGTAVRKTDGGLLRVYATVEDGVVQAVRVTGDFFAPQETVNAIEAAVKWTPIEEGELAAALAEAPAIEAIDRDELASTILAASRDHEPATAEGAR